MANRQNWSSQFAFIIAAIGSAIGLGNIWRFPYVMGENGGAVFLVAYFFFVFCICSVPLLAELLFGKIAQKGVVGAFKLISPKLKILGWLSVLTAIIVSSFYFVVGGWIIYYIVQSFSLDNVYNFESYFTNLTTSPSLSIGLTFLFLAACVLFVYRGVNKGIEFANKLMMPTFAIILFLLTMVTLQLPNAELGLKFIFYPDFSKVTPSMLLQALGQALFTLSLGMGALLTYGSYLKKDDSILKSAYSIIIADAIFALLAGVMIFPAVFSFGMEPNGGPGLVFVTLPKVFVQMQYGDFVSLGFFILLFFAALTSGISIVEVIAAAFIETFNISRKKASLIIMGIIGALSVPVSLSFGALNNFKIFGQTLFGLFDYTASNILMPLNTLLICVAVGWLLNISNDYIFKSEFLNKLFVFLAKYVLPLVLLVLLVAGLRTN